jgi:hypothetical protein
MHDIKMIFRKLRRRDSNEKKRASVTLLNDQQNVPHTPLSMSQSNEDALELKRQRERERYSQNREGILKRQREAYTQKNIASAPSHNNDQENETHTGVHHISWMTINYCMHPYFFY